MQVSERAVVARINRKLRPDLEMLRKSRSDREALDLGHYWVHDLSRNLAVETFVDVEALARELRVLREWESVRED